jgi:ribonuclease HI
LQIILQWKKNGWKTATNSDVKNRDLLEKIDDFRSHVDAKFVHVDGHSGIHGNEMADSLARQGVSKHV